MAWLRVDDGYGEHPKVVGLSDRAFRLHTVALCYCARNLTDGHLERRAVKVIAAILDKPVKNAVAELVKGRLWLERGDGSYEIKGYLDWNPPAAEVRHGREEAAARMRDLRAQRKAERDTARSGEQTGERSGSPSRPTTRTPKAVPVARPDEQRPTDHNLENITPTLREIA